MKFKGIVVSNFFLISKYSIPPWGLAIRNYFGFILYVRVILVNLFNLPLSLFVKSKLKLSLNKTSVVSARLWLCVTLTTSPAFKKSPEKIILFLSLYTSTVFYFNLLFEEPGYPFSEGGKARHTWAGHA